MAIRTIVANASVLQRHHHFVLMRPLLKYHLRQNHETTSTFACLQLELQLWPSSKFRIFRFSPSPLQFVITRKSSQATTSSLDKNYGVKDKKKKTLEPVKIMLISETDNVSVVTMDEATRIAHKRGLHLTQVDNADAKIKTEKQVFKLMKLGEVEVAGVSVRQAKKGGGDGAADAEAPRAKTSIGPAHKDVKTLIVTAKIGEHDLMSKVKSVTKWVQKGHRVNVFVNSNVGGSGDPETVFQKIESNVKEYARVFNKQNKGKDIRFQIEPLSVKSANAPTSTSESTSGKSESAKTQ